jgi:flagella basal body P-ring formation protein FlgA
VTATVFINATRLTSVGLGLALVAGCPLIAAASDNDHLRAVAPNPVAAVASNERVVDAEELHGLASQALERALRGRADRFRFSKPARVLSSTVIDAQGSELVAREVARAASLSSRMTVWVDVKQAGHAKRTLLVPVDVAAYRTGWVAMRDLPVGTRLSPGILREQEVDIAAGGYEPWAGDPEGLVLRSPVLAGHYLAAGQVEAAPAVSRGDVVQVVHRMGAVEVQTTANALQDGDLGKNIQVRISASQSPVLARVMAAGQVELIK